MTSPVSTLRVRGLCTGRGLIGAPAGSLQVANDVVSLLPGTVEPRKGFEVVSEEAENTQSADVVDGSGVAYGDGRVAQVRSSFGAPVLALHDIPGGTVTTTPVTLHPLGGVPMRSLGRRAMGCSGAGVVLIEGASARQAGVPRPVDPLATYVANVSGFLGNEQAVAYRLVFGRRLSDGTFTWGAPSGRVVVRTPAAGGGGPTQFSAIVDLYDDPETHSWWGPDMRVRIYRTDTVAVAIDPGDEMFLVYEGPVPDDAPPSGYRRYIDLTPDEMLGPPLYTNAETGDGEGLAGANYPPPLQCSDVASWDSHIWYAVHAERESWQAQLIGTDGITPGSTLIAFLGFHSPDSPPSSSYVLVEGTHWTAYTSGTPSRNVELTARRIIRAINENVPLLSAWYASGENDTPGLIEIRVAEGESIAGVYMYADNTTQRIFAQEVGEDFVTDYSQVQIRGETPRPGLVRWSKPGLPEAVPLLHELPVGDPLEPIVGMVGLRDGVVVAKTDGLYLIHGQSSLYGVQLLDASVRMADDARRGGRGTVQRLNNEVYLRAQDSHVYACTEAGARSVDTDVQDLIRHERSLYAAVDDRDGLYVLHLGGEGGLSEYSAQQLVYSLHARVWTRWSLFDWRWMSQWPDGGLVGGRGGIYDDGVLRTRNAGQVSDYQDDHADAEATFGVSDDGGVTQPCDVGGLVIGETYAYELALRDDESVTGIVLIPRPGEALPRILLTGSGPFPADAEVACRVRLPIYSRVVFAPWHGGSPGGVKRSSHAQLHFDRCGIVPVGDGVLNPLQGDVRYLSPWMQTQADGDATHQQQTVDDQALTAQERTGPWADLGATPIQPRTLRVTVPQAQQVKGMLSVGLETAQVRGFWRLAGVTLEVEQGLQRRAR